MKFLRALSGGLLWLGACLLGLVGAILCVTIILLPIGLPLLGLSRRLFTRAVGLMLPRPLVHPAQEAAKRTKRKTSPTGEIAKRAGKKSPTQKLAKRTRKKLRAVR